MNFVEPIRDRKKIKACAAYLKERDLKYWMMFVIGVNTGLRISDILNLTVADVRDQDHVTIREKKTAKVKRFLLNRSLRKDISFYLSEKNLSDEDFLIYSRKKMHHENLMPISTVQAYRIMNEAGEACGLESIGTHSLRKTFGYWHYKTYHDVALLMDLFSHSAPSITLRYIGINDDIKDKSMEEFYLM